MCNLYKIVNIPSSDVVVSDPSQRLNKINDNSAKSNGIKKMNLIFSLCKINFYLSVNNQMHAITRLSENHIVNVDLKNSKKFSLSIVAFIK